jgi:hypothetical protein
MASIRTTTLGAAVVGVGLLLGACASPAAKTSDPAAAPATPPHSAPPARVAAPPPLASASAPAAPAVQAVPVAQVAPVVEVAPVVHVAPVVPVAPVSAPPVPPVASPPASASPVASYPPSAPSAPSAPTPATPPSAPRPSAVPVAANSAPHFTTPDAAMRYLVAAYNSHDIAAERHVTTPDSRAALETERQWVNTFSFHSCTLNPGGGDYSCQFDMVSKVKTATAHDFNPFGDDVVENMGEITVLVAPAQRPGWYMYFNEGCGG